MAKKKTGVTPKSVLSSVEILKKLHALGYFGSQPWSQVKKISGKALESAVKEYQTFHGLEPTGVVGVRTAHVLARHRCGLPDFNISSGSGPCKWPMKKITYHPQLVLPGITEVQASLAFDAAIMQWANVCDIEPVRVDTPDLANIYARSGRGRAVNLDDRGGTLAWSELPCDVSANMQLDQMFDEAENWSFDMAVAVICHELGHALGLAHLGKGNLMAPYYDPNVTKPQKGDIAEMVKLYGKVKKAKQVSKGNNVDISGVITINGKPYRLIPQF
jgi:peptidoglycan hydrolase-like protein with peptidoglycan-binding domain